MRLTFRFTTFYIIEVNSCKRKKNKKKKKTIVLFSCVEDFWGVHVLIIHIRTCIFSISILSGNIALNYVRSRLDSLKFHDLCTCRRSVHIPLNESRFSSFSLCSVLPLPRTESRGHRPIWHINIVAASLCSPLSLALSSSVSLLVYLYMGNSGQNHRDKKFL